MAYEIPGFSFTLPAGADFSSGKQFRFCDMNENAKAINPTAGGGVIGVRYTRSKADEATTIVNSGICIVEAAGVLAPGDLVATDANGCAVKAAAGNVVVGRALEPAASSGIQIAVLLISSATNAA